MLLPKENVKYTIYFKNKGNPRAHAYTLTYVGTNGKGRLMFLNLSTGKFTSFTPGYFSKLLARNTVAAFDFDTNAPLNIVGPAKPQNLAGTREPVAPEDEASYENYTLRRLRSLSEAKSVSVLARIGYTPAELADKLEAIMHDEEKRISQDVVNKTFTDLMHANDVIDGRVNPYQITLGV